MTGDVLDALAAQRDELLALVAGPVDLTRPSRCPGWSVADVLVHLAQTDELAVASLEGRFEAAARALVHEAGVGHDVDDWAAIAVAEDPMAPEAARDRWRAASAAQLEAFRQAALDARVPWVAGTLAARTLATTRLTECWIHTGDVAAGLGATVAPTDRLWHTCRLAWRTLPYAFARAGLDAPAGVRFELVAPSGEPWAFGDEDAPTVVRGSAAQLCEVAGQRAEATAGDLTATGPSGEQVLALVRTFA